MRTAKSPQARAFAAEKLLERGWGKPAQHIEANINVVDKLSATSERYLQPPYWDGDVATGLY